MSELAIFGGPKSITADIGDMFTWPIVTKEDEDAIMDVLHRRAMSGTDVSRAFEEDFKKWSGAKYALGFNNGTASLQAAMYGCGVRRGDEVICPTMTYWASAMPVYSLGGTPVFANVEPDSLCLDPKDIEHRIGPKTKAILVVHYLGHPTDMDPIMEIARKHGLKVIEDVSHAQGGMYKGKMLGTIGDVGAMSLMSGKSFAIGEGGMLITDDKDILDHAVSLGHYEIFNSTYGITAEDLQPYLRLPMGGYKYRMHQMSSAMGRVQIKYYDERCAEIRKAMNYFWDLLEGVPGIRAHRVDESTGSTMGGWYEPHGLYVPEELGGLSVTRFTEAVSAEGFSTHGGANMPLHTHRIFNEADIYGDGKPTRIAFTDRDVREQDASLENSMKINSCVFSIPWFKHYRPETIEQHANAFKKAALNYKELLEGDQGNPPELGGWNFYRH